MSDIPARVRRLELWAWGAGNPPNRLPSLSDLGGGPWQDISTADLEAAPLASVISRICVFRDMEPEEGEDWESWYFAAFDMLLAEVRAIEAQSNAVTNPAPQRRATA